MAGIVDNQKMRPTWSVTSKNEIANAKVQLKLRVPLVVQCQDLCREFELLLEDFLQFLDLCVLQQLIVAFACGTLPPAHTLSHDLDAPPI